MGRPINKKYTGNPTLATRTFPAITFSNAWLMGQPAKATATVYILKQTGSNRYLATDGTNKGIVTLRGYDAALPGDGAIYVTPFSGAQAYAKSIKNRTVRTFGDNTYNWDPFNPATQPGQANLPLNMNTGTEKLLYKSANESAIASGGALYNLPNIGGVTAKEAQIFASSGTPGGAGQSSQAAPIPAGTSGVFNPSSQQRKVKVNAREEKLSATKAALKTPVVPPSKPPVTPPVDPVIPPPPSKPSVTPPVVPPVVAPPPPPVMPIEPIIPFPPAKPPGEPIVPPSSMKPPVTPIAPPPVVPPHIKPQEPAQTLVTPLPPKSE